MADTRLVGLLRRLRLGPASTPGQTDRDALRAFVRHRDEAAFAGIVHRHGPMVLRVCRNVLHHTEDAEDACQATFLVLARRAETIANGEVLASWLHGVAYRTALRARRDLGRRRAHERAAPVAARPDPTEGVAWSDVQVLLEAEISRLPARYRAAFVLCFLEGRSRTEAAAELGLSENTLSSRLARARDRLKRRLARRGVHLSAVLAAVALTTGTSESAMPGPFAEGISRAAMQFAARESVTGVSSFALQLTNGTLHTMTMSKITWAAGMLAVGGTLAVGTWGVGQGLGPPGSASGPSPGGINPRGEKPAAVDRSADYAQRQRSLKNLKTIALALHNYHDTHGRLPADLTDHAGKPLLSWRVAILPYIEGYDTLYKQFKLTEPWDSEHNLGLLAKMPEVLRVGFEPKGATHTHYQRFALAHLGPAPGAGEGGFGAAGGAGSATAPAGGGGPPMPGSGPPMGTPPAPGPGFGGPMGGAVVPGGVGAGFGVAPEPPAAGPRFPLHLHGVPDGTSNTIGVIEAGPPVPWSKPADFVYDPRQPLPKMTGPFGNVRNVAMMDGTALSLRPDLDEVIWRGLIDATDGQVIPGARTLRAQFPADSAEEKKALARMLEENQAMIAKLEEQFKEHTALLGLASKVTKDLERAETEQARIQEMVERLRLLNRKMRDDLGLRSGAPVPGGP